MSTPEQQVAEQTVWFVDVSFSAEPVLHCAVVRVTAKEARRIRGQLPGGRARMPLSELHRRTQPTAEEALQAYSRRCAFVVRTLKADLARASKRLDQAKAWLAVGSTASTPPEEPPR